MSIISENRIEELISSKIRDFAIKDYVLEFNNETHRKLESSFQKMFTNESSTGLNQKRSSIDNITIHLK